MSWWATLRTLFIGAQESPSTTTFLRGDLTWATPPSGSGPGSSPLTTKGDLYTYSTADARLGIGANDTILMADSAAATGNKWATPATVRTALSLVVGTNVQAYDAGLASLTAADAAAGLPYVTGPNTWSTATLTAAGLALLDDADAAAQRTTLGLATVASSGAYADLSGRPTLAAVATSGAYSDLTGAPSVPAMTYGAISTTSTSSNTTWTAITGSDVTIASGSKYYIRWMLSAYAAAATTGHRTRRVFGGGGAATVLSFHTIAQSAAAATVGHSSREGTNGFSPGTGAATSTTTAKGLVLVEALIECTASGTIGLELQSEVNASAVTVDGDGSSWVAIRQ